MSDSAKSSPTKNDGVPSLQQMVINAIPLSSIPPLSPAKKVKKASKKEKTPRVNLNSSSPSASIKKAKKKSKKSKSESRSTFTMSELHVDPLPSSGVATPAADPTVENVDASGKNSLNQNLDVPNPAETLGLKDPVVSGNLGKNVTTSLAPENLVNYSESDESPPPKTAEKDDNENPDVVIVNETTVSDKTIPTNSEASVARRTRSRAGKGVETANTPIQTPKPSRAGKITGRKPLYGPPKPNGSARWKFVYHRRLALERNLKDDILQCQSVVEAIEYAASPEYRQVFVRGKCVKFSPTVINQHLQRSSDEVAALKVTDNEVCKVLTGGRIKAEEAAETAEGEPDGQEGLETSGSDDDTDDMLEDSDENHKRVFDLGLDQREDCNLDLDYSGKLTGVETGLA
ncbi:uncharacterized protein LOC123904925 [Trifolium pratense]|nr:uncharacterized protein LOC123904925 [Trifolium pratense]